MIQRMGRKKYNIFAFDIESHNDEESIAKKETSMWLGCLINEESKMNDESSYLYDMDEFLNRIEDLSSGKRKHGENRPIKNVAIYVYNLSFEYSFLLPYLLKRGFKYKEKIEDNDEMVFNSICTRSVSSVWLANIKFHRSSGIIVLKDMAKIFGGGLSNVAKSFGLETQKGVIDYRKNRLHNYKVTKEEKEYCFKDTRILIEILLKMKEMNDKDFWKVSSIASYSMRQMIKVGYPRSLRPMKSFRSEYPNLSKEENEFLRNGVEGGITYANPLYQFKHIKSKILHIDLHSAHPSSAFYCKYPYGKGIKFKGKPKYDMYRSQIACCRVRISYDSVLLHSVIKLIGLPFVEDYEITLWDFEIETMKKCYVNLKVKYIDGYIYYSKYLRWRNFYKIHFEQRLIAKQKHDSFNVMLHKLIINSSYGKLLEKPHNELFENILDEEGVITSNVIIKPKDEWKDESKYTYLPIGSGIPARTRTKLVETALLFGFKNIIYFDTDSIFMIYNEETKKIWESNLIDKENHLGGWGLEEICDSGEFACAKRYKTLTNGVTNVKMGGINFDREVEFNEINIDFNKFKVRRAYRVKGGTIIDFQEKKISVAHKFEGIYNDNKNAII